MCERDILKALESLSPDNVHAVLALAELPDTIRGFGHVKDRNIRAGEPKRVALLAAIAEPSARPAAAAVLEEEGIEGKSPAHAWSARPAAAAVREEVTA